MQGIQVFSTGPLPSQGRHLDFHWSLRLSGYGVRMTPDHFVTALMAQEISDIPISMRKGILRER
jgi:hypothetical protein